VNKLNCPYCNAKEDNCVPDVVYRHAENYGGGMSNFRCLTCKKVIRASVNVCISIKFPEKTNEKSDW